MIFVVFKITFIYLKILNCRKRKVHLYEEQSSNWNPKIQDKFGGFNGKWSKQKMNPYNNQESNMSKDQNMMVESNIKRIQVEQFILEKCQNKDSQSLKENNLSERYDQRLQWKARNDVINGFQNIVVDSTHRKTPQSSERFNTNENHLVDEVFLNNAEHWPYHNPCEGIKKVDQETIVSSTSKCCEAYHDKEYSQIEHNLINSQNMSSKKILESLHNPILSSKNMGCVDFIEPLNGWVYHTNNGTLSGIYTLEQLQKGLETKFLPDDLPIYQV